MGTFNYTKLHIFNKKGVELPLSIDSSVKITIPSNFGNAAVFYPVTNNSKDIVSYYKESSGSRFSNSSNVLSCKVNDDYARATVTFNSYSANDSTEQSASATEYSIDDIVSINPAIEDLNYPSLKLNSYLNFDVISTGLVETESLYLLVYDDASANFKSIYEYDETWSNRYELLFYIDCRHQEDFRFFDIQNDEVVWTDRVIMNCNSAEEKSVRVNIGFTSEEEGVFKETLHICILDRGENKTLGLDECDIIPIGSISLSAETIGEDERYRTLFTNFGIPDPKEYLDLFTNTALDEDKPDNILLNQNSKKLFLTYSEIFPYAGTYKALINAIKVLGYDDLYFKEWYKRTKSTTGSNLISYDITYNSDINANVINNASIEERIHLKKLNWLSMVYKLNQEIVNSVDDTYGFPEIETKYDFEHKDIIIKLIALRDWLQKYIIGLNCRIIDVGGEGIYFERYKFANYATYQTVYDWINEHNIAPYIIEDNNNILVDSSANININIGIDDSKVTLEELERVSFADFCEGYFDSSNNYHIRENSLPEDESTIFIGKTLFSYTDLNYYQFKASVNCDSFAFYHSAEQDSYLTSDSAGLRIANNRLYLNPLDIHNGKEVYAKFEKLPLIYLKSAVIYEPIVEDASGNEHYWLDADNSDNVTKIVNYNDYKLIYPGTNAEFAYKEDDAYGYPVLIVKNYNFENIDASSDTGVSYILEILNGKLLFNTTEDNNKTVCVNFEFAPEEDEQKIYTTVSYLTNDYLPKSYLTAENNYSYGFANNTNYDYFVNTYNNTPETAIKYDFAYSLNVNYAGEYTVDVIGKDIHNNIFAAPVKNKVVIGTPGYSAFSYTNVKSGNVKDTTTVDSNYIKSNYINYCIYDKEYNVNFVKDESNNVSYVPYSYSLPVPKKDDKLHFSNKLEKFIVDASTIISKGGSTSAATIIDGNIVDIYNGYSMNLVKAYPTSNHYEFNRYSVDCTNEMFSNTDNDVNVVFYNELGGYPIFQTYGQMYLSNESTGTYTLSITDDTAAEYIWASGEGMIPGIIAEDLASLTIDYLKDNGYDDNSILNLEFGTDALIEMFKAFVNYNKGAMGIGLLQYLHIFDNSSSNYRLYLNDGETEHFLNDVLFNSIDEISGQADTIMRSIYTKEGETSKYILNQFAQSMNLPLLPGTQLSAYTFISNLAGGEKHTADLRKMLSYSYLYLGKSEIEEEYIESVKDCSSNKTFVESLPTEVTGLLNALHTAEQTKLDDFVIEDELLEECYFAISDYEIQRAKDIMDYKILPNDTLSHPDMLKYLETYLTSAFKEYGFNEYYKKFNYNIFDDSSCDASINDMHLNDLSHDILELLADSTIEYEIAYKTCTIWIYTYIAFIMYYIIINEGSEMHGAGWVTKNIFNWTNTSTDEAVLEKAIRYAIYNYMFESGDNEEHIVGKIARAVLLKKRYFFDNEQIIYTSPESRVKKYISELEKIHLQRTTDWITTDTFVNDRGQKHSVHVFYYAVAYKDSETGNIYYLKTDKMSDSGNRLPGKSTTVTDFTFDLEEMLQHKEIGVYIEPINKASVVISRANPDGGVLPENQLQVQIASARGITVNPGDMIKIMFCSTLNNSYFAQSSYKVIRAEVSYLIVEGNINNEYIRILGDFVFYHITNANYIHWLRDILNGNYIERPDRVTINHENVSHVVDAITIISEQIPKKNASTGTPITTVHTFVKASKLNDITKTGITEGYFEILRDPASQEYIRLTKDGAENTGVDMYMTYAHTAYVDYVLPANGNSVETPENIALQLDDTNFNRRYLRFIDSKFVLNIKDFDINEGIYSWMDIVNPAEAIHNTFGGTPEILSKPIYKYDNTTGNPTVTEDCPCIVYTISGNLPADSYIYWRIYQHGYTSNDKLYKFESYNKVLYLDATEPGIYDIEMNVYDKYGNVSKNLIKGAYKVA